MGGFLSLAALDGASWVHGIEYCESHVHASRHLLDALKTPEQHVEITHGDATDDAVLKTVVDIMPLSGIDHLLLLSMGKHVGGPTTIEKWVKLFNAKHTYVETNAITADKVCPYAEVVRRLGGRVVGSTVDRNYRILYRIDR